MQLFASNYWRDPCDLTVLNSSPSSTSHESTIGRPNTTCGKPNPGTVSHVPSLWAGHLSRSTIAFHYHLQTHQWLAAGHQLLPQQTPSACVHLHPQCPLQSPRYVLSRSL